MNLHYILDLDSPMAISEMLIISLITDKQINFSGNLIILKTINIEKIKQRILTKIHKTPLNPISHIQYQHFIKNKKLIFLTIDN